MNTKQLAEKIGAEVETVEAEVVSGQQGTALAKTDDHQPMPISPPSHRPEIFGNIIAFENAQRMAKALASSNIVPPSYQGNGNVANAMVAMEIANRIGASVFMVMQQMAVIHGKPTFSSAFLIAAINGCGRFEPLRYKYFGELGQPSRGCLAYTYTKKDHVLLEGTPITIEMAIAEGWVGKSGSKWRTMPEQMLAYRAAAFWSRLYAPDLTMGFHERSEIEDVAQ